jgi:hypothetical protein
MSALPDLAHLAIAYEVPHTWNRKVNDMDLLIWLPAMFLLGLATLGLLTAFVGVCAKV